MSLVHAQSTDEWVNITADCLETGTCTRDLYDTLNIREEQAQNEANTFDFLVRDLVLSSTFFIGTILAFSLVYSGFLIIMWWSGNESMVENGKKWVKRSLIGLVLVMFSYTIIRGIQFVAQGQG